MCGHMCACKSKYNTQMENSNCLVNTFVLQDHKIAKDILLAIKDRPANHLIIYGLWRAKILTKSNEKRNQPDKK